MRTQALTINFCVAWLNTIRVKNISNHDPRGSQILGGPEWPMITEGPKTSTRDQKIKFPWSLRRVYDMIM